jgi:hypothetical protein
MLLLPFLLLLLLLLIGAYSIFYSVCLFSCDVDIQCFGGRPDGLVMFGFPFFAILASELSFMLFI